MGERPGRVRCIAVGLCLPAVAGIAVAAAFGSTQPFSGRLDRSFGKGGRAVAALGPTFARSSYRTMVRQPDGSIVLGGSTDATKGIYIEPTGFVQRRDSSGALDGGFGGGLVRLPDVADLAPGGEGRVLAAVPEDEDLCGSSSTVRRLLPDGAPDPSFGKGGTSDALPLSVHQIAVDSEGRIVAVGTHHFNPCGHDPYPQLQPALARLRPDGSLDPSFGENGVVLVPHVDSYVVSSVAGVTIREDGTIVLAAEGSLTAFTSTGAPDPAFGTGGAVKLSGTAAALIALPGNKLALASTSAEISCCQHPGHFAVSRYLPDGGLDPAFGGGSVSLAVGRTDYPTALAAEPDGSILLGGEASEEAECPAGECDYSPLIARFTADGQLDPSFGAAGVVTPDLKERTRADYASYVADFAVAPSGQILFAGGSGDDGEATVSALRPDGAPDGGFGSGGRAAQVETLPSTSEASGLAIASTGAILASAWSNAGTNRERTIFVAFKKNGEADERVGPAGLVEPEAGSEIKADGKGRFYAAGRSGNGPISRFDERGRRDLGYGSQGRAALPRGFRVESLVVRRGGQALAVGSYKDHLGMAAFALTARGRPDRRFGHDGLVVVGFGPEARAVALAGAYDRRGRVVLFGNVRRYAAMVRLLPDGRLDRRFARRGRQLHMSGLIDSARAAVIARRHSIFVATALQPGYRGPSVALFRLHPDGRHDRSFGERGLVITRAQAPLVGFFAGKRLTLVSGIGRWGERGLAVRAFELDGSPAYGFGHRGVVLAGISKRHAFRPVAAAREPDGRIVVAVTSGGIEEAGARIELLRFR